MRPNWLICPQFFLLFSVCFLLSSTEFDCLFGPLSKCGANAGKFWGCIVMTVAVLRSILLRQPRDASSFASAGALGSGRLAGRGVMMAANAFCFSGSFSLLPSSSATLPSGWACPG
jgi:hypothetical protein